MTTKPTEPATIGGKQLAQMVNLTERRLRQLAEQKRIPEPVKGKWPMEETIRRLFAYYQCSSEEYSRERTLKLAAQRRRCELDLAKAQGKVVEVDQVCASIMRIMPQARSMMEQRLINEYPIVVSGLEPSQVRVYSRRLMDDMLAAFQKLADEFGAPAEPMREKAEGKQL